MREAKIQHAIREELGKMPGVDIMRNNVVGTKIEGRMMSGGLGAGSADLVGLVSMKVPSLGFIGRFFALEVKGPRGRLSAKQAQWLRRVRRNGGFAAVVRSTEEAIAAVERCRNGAVE